MKVNSSTIAEINHDGKNLTVEFVNGRVYTYESVPTTIYEAFVKADSKGKFLHENIVGRYNYLRIR